MKKLIYLLILLFAFNINAQQVIYKVKENRIIGIKRVSNEYILKNNEYSSSIWYQKPFFNGTVVVESITQTEIDQREQFELERQEKEQFQKELGDGREAVIDLEIYLKKHFNNEQLKNMRSKVKPIFVALRNGYWQDALYEVTTIDNVNSTVHSRKILNYIENYLNQ